MYFLYKCVCKRSNFQTLLSSVVFALKSIDFPDSFFLMGSCVHISIEVAAAEGLTAPPPGGVWNYTHTDVINGKSVSNSSTTRQNNIQWILKVIFRMHTISGTASVCVCSCIWHVWSTTLILLSKWDYAYKAGPFQLIPRIQRTVWRLRLMILRLGLK